MSLSGSKDKVTNGINAEKKEDDKDSKRKREETGSATDNPDDNNQNQKKAKNDVNDAEKAQRLARAKAFQSELKKKQLLASSPALLNVSASLLKKPNRFAANHPNNGSSIFNESNDPESKAKSAALISLLSRKNSSTSINNNNNSNNNNNFIPEDDTDIDLNADIDKPIQLQSELSRNRGNDSIDQNPSPSPSPSPLNSNSNGPVESTNGPVNVMAISNMSNKTKLTPNHFSLFTEASSSASQSKPGPSGSDKEKMEEEDPLDAFMSGLASSLTEREKKDLHIAKLSMERDIKLSEEKRLQRLKEEQAEANRIKTAEIKWQQTKLQSANTNNDPNSNESNNMESEPSASASLGEPSKPSPSEETTNSNQGPTSNPDNSAPTPTPSSAPAPPAASAGSSVGSKVFVEDELISQLEVRSSNESLATSRMGERFYDDENIMDVKEDDDKKPKMSWLEKQKKGLKKDLKLVDHKNQSYIPFRKDLYIESRAVKNMTDEQIKSWREEKSVKIRGKYCPKPIFEWDQSGLPDGVLKTIKLANYPVPFPIQQQALPVIMSGRDCIACAKTGSGKTAAFVLPMLRHVADQPPLEKGQTGPIALIMAPTRELVTQIYNEVKKFGKSLNVIPVAVYGGAPMADQISAIKKGSHIMIATPGRLIDLLCTNSARLMSLARVTYVVMDEADRMFDMGFEPQITRVLDNIRPDRQVVLFSATFPKAIESLAKKALKMPIEIVIGGRSVASDTITQIVEVMEGPDFKTEKFNRLLELLGKWHTAGSVLVFVDRQEVVDYLFKDLTNAGYACVALHGGMDQSDRDSALSDFKQGHRTIMIATSVIARGLDVKDLILVVNYEVPNHYEDYIHRVGRTGRAGKSGTAVTFIEINEERYAPELVKALEASKQEVPPKLAELSKQFIDKIKAGTEKYRGGFHGHGFKFDEKEEKDRQNRTKIERGLLITDGKNDEEEEVDESIFEDTEYYGGPSNDSNALVTFKNKADDLRMGEVMDPLERAIVEAKAAAEHALKASKMTNNDSSISMALAMKNALSKHAVQTQNAPTSTNTGISSVISSINAALSDGNKKALFTCEIEVNDYPQRARWIATHKGQLDQVLDDFGVGIVTKGSYIPPGRPVPFGQRKLYLHITGESEMSVNRARAEIVKRLEAAAEESDARGEEAPRSGKYTVL